MFSSAMKAPKAVMAARMVLEVGRQHVPVEHDAVQPEDVLLLGDLHPALQVEMLLRGDAHMPGQRVVGGQPCEVPRPTPPLSQSGARPKTRSDSCSEKEETQMALRRNSPHEGERRQPLIGLQPQPEVQHLARVHEGSVGA